MLPSDWPCFQVDDIFHIQQGKQVSQKNRLGDNQKPFLRTKNVLWRRLDLSELDQMHFTDNDEERLALHNGDLLLCEGGWVGRTAIWRDEIESCYYQNHLHRLRVSNETADPMFALFWFWYAFEFGNIYFGHKNVTTIPNMSKSRLGGLPMPLPPLSEQRRIAAVLSLVQKAIEEQERLIALTTELKKTLMYKLFTEGTRGESQKQTEIGPIPESWKLQRLQNLCDLIVDCPHTTPRFVDFGVRIVRNFNFRDGKFIAEPSFYTTEQEYKNRTKRAIPTSGDVLFSREAPIGEACVIPSDVRMSLGQRTMLLRPKCDKLDSHFLVYSFYSNNVKKWMVTTAGGMTVPHLNVADVRQMFVPVAPLEEQFIISKYLLSIEIKLELCVSIKNKLNDLFRTLLHQLMTAQIRVNDLDLAELGIELSEGQQEVVS